MRIYNGEKRGELFACVAPVIPNGEERRKTDSSVSSAPAVMAGSSNSAHFCDSSLYIIVLINGLYH